MTVPIAAAYDSDLTASDYRVLIRCLEGDGPLSAADLALQLSLSQRAVIGSRKRLVEKGYLVATDVVPRTPLQLSIGNIDGPPPEIVAHHQRFGAFWMLYPKRKNRLQAQKQWLKLKPDQQLTDTILEDVRWRIENDTEWHRGFAPYPQGYLRDRRWEDERSGVGGTVQQQILGAIARSNARLEKMTPEQLAGFLAHAVGSWAVKVTPELLLTVETYARLFRREEPGLFSRALDELIADANRRAKMPTTSELGAAIARIRQRRSPGRVIAEPEAPVLETEAQLEQSIRDLEQRISEAEASGAATIMLAQLRKARASTLAALQSRRAAAEPAAG